MKTKRSVNRSHRCNQADHFKCSNTSASARRRLQVNFETDADQTHAFTFIDLLVVVAVLAFMICVLATARAASRPNSQGALCLNNLKQTIAAFTMYTHDNSDLFPPNFDSTSCSWTADNESGWMPPGSFEEPNEEPLNSVHPHKHFSFQVSFRSTHLSLRRQ